MLCVNGQGLIDYCALIFVILKNVVVVPVVVEVSECLRTGTCLPRCYVRIAMYRYVPVSNIVPAHKHELRDI